VGQTSASLFKKSCVLCVAAAERNVVGWGRVACVGVIDAHPGPVTPPRAPRARAKEGIIASHYHHPLLFATDVDSPFHFLPFSTFQKPRHDTI
jgi:hypothetical protein